MTFEVTQNGTTYRIEASIHGRFEPRGPYSPPATPDIDIESVEPEPGQFDAAAAREQITEELIERSRR